MHVLSSEQFTPEMLDHIFLRTDEFREKVSDLESRRNLRERYPEEILANLFYSESLRTRFSFEFAAKRLGMEVIGSENAGKFTSAAKGETLEHSIRVINEYHPAVIVLRHGVTGSAAKAASVSEVPIINAGDGNGEHPTQALLDVYTILREKRRLCDLKIVFGGDLARGRTIRSLAKILSLYPNNQMTFTSTPELAMRPDITNLLRDRNVTYFETEEPESTFGDADVVYWTRLQKERPLEKTSDDPDEEVKTIDEQDPRFILGETALKLLPNDSTIMHPMPIAGEIESFVDDDPRAAYFRQAGNGPYIRMAVIDMLIKNELMEATQ